jgi:hypothetical protein
MPQRGRNMKKNGLVIVCVLTGLVVVCGAIYALRSPEPSYQGKSLSVWLAETDFGTWPRQSSDPADEAIRHIGTNAFPTITRLLRSRDSALKLKLLQVSYKLPFLRLHISTQNERHHRAIAACFALGPDAKPLVPEVAKDLNHMDPYLRPFAQLWLISLGSDADAAVPALIALLRNKNNPTRDSIPQSLGKISMRRRDEVAPVLKECLTDTNSMVSFWAQDALNILNAGDTGAPAKAVKR